MGKICGDLLCVSKRILAEYGYIFFSKFSYPIFPCRISFWGGEDDCKECLLIHSKVLRKFLVCMMNQEGIQGDDFALDPNEDFDGHFEMCSGGCVKSIKDEHDDYWRISTPQQLKDYMKCTHVLCSDDSCAPYKEDVLYFLIAARLCLFPKNSQDIERVFWLMCQNKPLYETLFEPDEQIKTDVKDYCERMKSSGQYFEVLSGSNHFEKQLHRIFQRMCLLWNDHPGINLIGIKQRLLDYINDVNSLGPEENFV